MGGLARWVLSALVLTLALPASAQAAFPGANGKIAFQTNRDGNYEIYLMNADGSGQTNLTSNASSDYNPTWSPDGTQIAFASDRDGNSEVYTMNGDGSGQTNLTNNASFDYQPTWSPDGMQIAFTSNRDPDGEIFVMNADGSGQTQLTFNGTFDDEPSWSPDGTKIAFINQQQPGNYEIFTMNPDGSGQTNLTNNGGFNSVPDWSPDGTQIAYHSGAGFCALNCEVFAMNADGSGQTNLTNNPATDAHAAWSPDGAKIAFESDRDAPPGEIYTMNPDGSGVARLTNNVAADVLATWQPLVDTDNDGCTDYAEINNPPNRGGGRDPLNFWDFFDVPTAGFTRDKKITVADILAVVQRYGANGDTGIDPLSIPNPAPAYHTAYDRTFVGPDLWDLGPPNGHIRVDDILMVIKQYSHSCSQG